MTLRCKLCLTGTFLLTASLPGLAETPANDRAEPRPKITILVYDYAGVTAETQQGAEKVATQILATAGVQTAWPDCSLAELLEQPECNRASNPTKLVLRILPGSKAARAGYQFHSSICGFTVQHEGVGEGYLVTLFYDCIEKTAENTGMAQSLIMGHMVAHEIGHLLLPIQGHFRRGIMRAKWGPKDWQRASRKLMFFPGKQAELLRVGVLARMRQQETAPLAALASLELAAPQARQPEGRLARTTKEYFNVQNGSK